MQWSMALEQIMLSWARRTGEAVSNVGAYLYAARATRANRSIGIIANGSDYAFKSTGNSFATGNWINGSDERLKEKIKPVQDALSIIGKLRPKTYFFRQKESFQSYRLPQEKQIGLIAQEVEEVLPEVVHEIPFFNTDEEGKISLDQSTDFKGINYTALIPLAIASIQEQQEIIQQQKREIDELLAELTKLKNQQNDILNRLNNLEGETSTTMMIDQGVYLSQNAPNPHSGQTRIKFVHPNPKKIAKIQLVDIHGRKYGTHRLPNVSSGTVLLNFTHLSSGTYYYQLLLDSQLVESKKMIIKH